ncbi:MAG: hypothetical protein ACJ73S_32455 [Mycobacteriales bacterium]
MSDQELLAAIHGYIDRYDRLRASTSTRASVLLSANAALTAGTIVLTNSRLSLAASLVAKILLEALAALTMALCVLSISLTINAIATWRTIRSIHGNEIPSRFLFNWGDTLRAVDGFSDFRQKVIPSRYGDLVEYGVAELWTSILQHRRRHKFLRYGIHAFRLAVACFSALAALALFLVR